MEEIGGLEVRDVQRKTVEGTRLLLGPEEDEEDVIEEKPSPSISIKW